MQSAFRINYTIVRVRIVCAGYLTMYVQKSSLVSVMRRFNKGFGGDCSELYSK